MYGAPAGQIKKELLQIKGKTSLFSMGVFICRIIMDKGGGGVACFVASEIHILQVQLFSH